jgi:hypothetical protein
MSQQKNNNTTNATTNNNNMVLTVRVISANIIINTEGHGKMDPYVILKYEKESK